MRFSLRELAGGLGDAGLFIPIAVAMIALNGLNATAVFALAGLAYLATALYFRVPVPVQPLKAFAAAAIALGLSAETLAAGALLMAAAMALLALTGTANWLAARFPAVLVRGIQASVALLLARRRSSSRGGATGTGCHRSTRRWASSSPRPAACSSSRSPVTAGFPAA